MQITTPRQINIYIFDDLNALDVAGASEAFYAANMDGPIHYTLRYVSHDGSNIRTSCGLTLGADIGLNELAAESHMAFEDLLLPGGGGVFTQIVNKNLIKFITNWQQSHQNRRLISVCSGALILAASGKLDGRIATTHWSSAQEAEQRFKKVNWQVDRIYTCDENIFTSAGVTAGIDLALAIIGQDLGEPVALKVARELVVTLRRSGGQTQYSDFLTAQYQTEAALEKLLTQLVATPHKNWTLELMADAVGMTSRTLSRKFRAQLDCSPVLFVEKIRVNHASNLLSLGKGMAQAVRQSGFGSLQRMQRGFERQIGITPAAYVKKFS